MPQRMTRSELIDIGTTSSSFNSTLKLMGADVAPSDNP